MRSRVALLLCLAGCPSTPPTVTHVQPTDEPAPESNPTPPGYVVHEWGLIDVAANGDAEVAAGPGRPFGPVRKPVLYVRLDDGLDALTFTARVSLPSGKLLEHWPPATQSDVAALGWLDVAAARAHCNTKVPPAPARAATADGIREVDDLPLYDAPGAACLTVGGVEAGMLFYRGAVGGLELPLVVTREADFSAKVSARTKGLQGEVLRISTGLSGPWPVGHVVVSRVKVPGAGASASLQVGSVAVDRGVEDEHLRDAMRELGLADDEAEAFVRAWGGALFGEANASRELRDASSRRWSHVMPQDVVLYWLPQKDVDRIAPLSFEPPPREVRRAMLVRVDLGAVATAGPSPVLGTP